MVSLTFWVKFGSLRLTLTINKLYTIKDSQFHFCHEHAPFNFHSSSHIICGIKQSSWDFEAFIPTNQDFPGDRETVSHSASALVSEGSADGLRSECALKPSSRRPQNTNSFIRYPNCCKSVTVATAAATLPVANHKE